MKITISRETQTIFVARSETPYWTDGNPICERLAFNKSGTLSNVEAQAIDRANGNRYLLVSPFGIKNSHACESARNLPIGGQFTFEVR